MTKTSKYLEIEDYFVSGILNEMFVVGQQLPSEKELCEAFNTSRMTINKAMTNLMKNGYIKRIPGNGSFVDNAYLTPKQDFLHPHSISQDIESFGMVPGSKLLEYRIIRGRDNPAIASELKVDPDAFIHYFVRMRTGDGKPFCLSYSYIVYDLLPNLNVNALESSFNVYLQSIGLKRSSGYTAFSSVLSDEEQSKYFGRDNIALLKQKIFWNYNNKPFEITTHYYANNLSVVIQRESPIALSNSASPYSKVINNE